MNLLQNKSPKTIKNDKPFFSAYLNLATHNAVLVINDISNRLEINKSKKDTLAERDGLKSPDKLLGILIENNDPVKVKEIIDSLRKKMPFLEAMAESCYWRKSQQKQGIEPTKPDQFDTELYINAFRALIDKLWGYRNWLSHYISAKPKFCKDLLACLRNSFDRNRRYIVEKFGYTSVETNHLVRLGRSKDWHENVRLDRPDFHYSFYNADINDLSENGIIYLTCLFLERKYSQLFLKQIRGFKDSTTTEKQATLHAFSTNNIILPKNTVVSADSKDSLLLNAFNELIKAPSKLFKALDESNKKIFRPVTHFERDDEEGPLLVRRKNRFNYFALNFLDKMEVFKSIRFPSIYGKFYYNVYESDITRRLYKNLYGYARLEDVKKHKAKLKQNYPELFIDSKDVPPDYKKPYILDFPARFIWDENQFPISLSEKKLEDFVEKEHDTKYKKPKSIYPDIILSAKEIPALVFLVIMYQNHPKFNENSTNSIKGGVIQKWYKNYKKFLQDVVDDKIQPVSKKSIPNLFRKSDNKEQNSQFLKEFEDRKTKLNEKLEEKKYGIDTTMIPGKIRDYLLAITPINQHQKAHKIIRQMINESTERIKRIENKNKFRKSQKLGQQNSNPIQTGKLADFVAKDLIYFQKKQEGKKNFGFPNSDQYQAIQKSLALWSYSKNDFLKLANQFNYFGKNKVHHFLSESIFNSNSFIQVYINYLTEKIKYLKILAAEKASIEKMDFLKISPEKDIKTLAKNILNSPPLPTPKGLFFKACKDFITNNHRDNIAPEMNKIQNLSTPKLIKLWFRMTCDDKSQGFYEYKRSYEIINIFKDTRDNTKKPKNKSSYLNLSEREKFFKEAKAKLAQASGPKLKINHIPKDLEQLRKQFKQFIKNESEIKLMESQDILLYLMARKMLSSRSEEEAGTMEVQKLDNFLPDIKPTGDKSSNTSKPLQFTIPNYSVTITNNNGYELEITQENLKAKDFGKFNRLLYDRRIENLVPYLCEGKSNKATIPFSRLEEEFHNYEVYRVKNPDDSKPSILASILEFEETLYNTNKEDIDKKLKEDKVYIEHKIFLEVLDEKYDLSIKPDFRNAFYHNQYPNKNKISEVQIDSNKPIIQQIATFAIEKYQNAIKKIRSDKGNRPF